MRFLRNSEVQRLSAVFNAILDSTYKTPAVSPEDVEMKMAIRLGAFEAVDILAGRPVQKFFADPIEYPMK